MKGENRRMENSIRKNYHLSIIKSSVKLCSFLLLSLFLINCSEIQTPKSDPFIGENSPPPKQEFRWSNGKTPKSFDPALASASPETDIVRTLFEGLTDVNPATSEAIPAISDKWTSSPDFKIWTFQLRKDAKWSNGETVTADDFVRSWKRLTELGDKVSQRGLLKNIVGMDSEDVLPIFADDDVEIADREENSNKSANETSNQNASSENNSNGEELPQDAFTRPEDSNKMPEQTARKTDSKAKFGVQAIDKFSLKVTLIQPDNEFPLLVAHPIFRPIFGDGKDFEKSVLDAKTITNGAFRIISVAKDGISLERNPDYWNRAEVKLERVKFIPSEDAEMALAAYRAGEIDAITNASFQPLALKLLQPFGEFHQTVHGALNYYEFNLNSKPFDDFRVRKALAISIDRKRLTEDEMDGATEPALNFLPFETKNERLKEDVEKAKRLLSEAGYSNGENFPVIKLLVNRNNMQQKIAKSVAKMWQKNLNVSTEIIVKDKVDFENSIQIGDFSLARRGIVLPTHNEIINMLAMFEHKPTLVNQENKEITSPASNSNNQILDQETAESNLNFEENETQKIENKSSGETNAIAENKIITTEEEALKQIPAIPLYYPTSYSLVKPYIKGFELNVFDALSLKNVEIDNDWQPKDSKNISNSQNAK